MRIITKNVLQEGIGSLEVKVTFDRSGLILTESPLGLIVELEGCKTTGFPGGPSLPSQIIRLALPVQTRVTRVMSRRPDPITVTREPVHVAPAQPPPPDVDEPLPETACAPGKHVAESSRMPRFEAPRPKLYEREVRDFHKVARLLGTREIGLVQIALIEVKPIRLDKDSYLRFFEEVDVSVLYQVDEDFSDKSRTYSNSQARRLVALARAQVDNPDLVWDFSREYKQYKTSVDYLVITDNHTWDETTMEPGDAVDGDFVSTFQQLVDWKEQRGLKARVVTVSDIVNGVHGDFSSNARDLQEVIRNFLKWAYNNWGIAWVLLGGDVNIIPVRKVAGAEVAIIEENEIDPPEPNKSYWDSAERCLKMHMTQIHGELSTDDRRDYPLVHPKNGIRIPHMDDDVDTIGAISVLWSYRWYFTNSTYSKPIKGIPAAYDYYVRVDAAPYVDEDKIRGKLQWLYYRNLIATDLYYANIITPVHPVPHEDHRTLVKHDWDANSNKVYAQNYAWEDGEDQLWVDHDSVFPLQADLSVGRAPVKTVTQAENFVNKVICYEKFQRTDGTTAEMEWPGRLLLCSSNWTHRIPIEAMDNVSDCPPDDEKYCCPDPDYSLIKFGTWENDLQLIAQVSGEDPDSKPDLRLLPYYFDVYGNPGQRGWHFAVSASDATPSANEYPFPPDKVVHVPVPTEWIVVRGDVHDLQPEKYLWDKYGPDLSMEEQETLRTQIAQELPLFKVVSRLYEDDIDLPAEDVDAAALEHLTTGTLMEALGTGPHFVSYAGHGTHLSTEILPKDITSILESKKHTFIGYADACWTGQFDWEHEEESTCLGERLLKIIDHGAVAYIGSTRYSWIRIGDDFQRNFFSALRSTRHLGLMHDARLICPSFESKEESWEWINRKMWTVFALNLLGDPEMPVWDHIPFYLVPTIPENLDLEKLKDYTWDVAVQARLREQTEPLPGATVHVRCGKFKYTAVTDRTGKAKILLSPRLKDTLQTTVSCPGYMPITCKTRIKDA